MQRCHHQDLSGHLLEQGGWEHLCLPAEYEGSRRATSLGFVDPREQHGDLLWPEQFGPVDAARPRFNQKTLVGSVLKQTTDEVAHSG